MRAVASLLGLMLIASCGGDKDGKGKKDKGDDDDDVTVDGMLERQTYSDTTDGDGYFDVDVEVTGGVTAFQVTGTSAEFVSLEELYDPSGNRILYWEDWWYSDNSLTDAFFGYGKVTAFNWPIRDVDPALEDGTYRVRMSLLDNRGFYQGNTPVDVAVDLKADGDFAAATVKVQIVYAEGVDQASGIVEAVEGAVARWHEVWGAYGLVLEETYVSSTLDPDLPFAYNGSQAVAEVAATKGDGALQVIIGETIGGDNFTYGIAAGIPGTVEATPNSFVVISWLVHSGQNAVFDDDEIALMGETMAHEVGHFAGLYHPVESDYSYWDALDDTSECRNRNSCEDDLGTNLMFPYSICGGGSCVTTDQVTPDQQGVMHRYLGAL